MKHNIWERYGYFKQQPGDFGSEKENIPEMSVFYLNRGISLLRITKSLSRRLFFTQPGKSVS